MTANNLTFIQIQGLKMKAKGMEHFGIFIWT